MSKQRIQLSDHFTYFRLLRFVLPCIGTTLFTSIYGIVDGLCVSNFVGKTACRHQLHSDRKGHRQLTGKKQSGLLRPDGP